MQKSKFTARPPSRIEKEAMISLRLGDFAFLFSNNWFM